MFDSNARIKTLLAARDGFWASWRTWPVTLVPLRTFPAIGKRVLLGKVNDTEDQFDPDSINLLLRDLQTGWLRRFDEAK
jgi:hypothetical protein